MKLPSSEELLSWRESALPSPMVVKSWAVGLEVVIAFRRWTRSSEASPWADGGEEGRSAAVMVLQTAGQVDTYSSSLAQWYEVDSQELNVGSVGLGRVPACGTAGRTLRVSASGE